MNSWIADLHLSDDVCVINGNFRPESGLCQLFTLNLFLEWTVIALLHLRVNYRQLTTFLPSNVTEHSINHVNYEMFVTVSLIWWDWLTLSAEMNWFQWSRVLHHGWGLIFNCWKISNCFKINVVMLGLISAVGRCVNSFAYSFKLLISWGGENTFHGQWVVDVEDSQVMIIVGNVIRWGHLLNIWD